MKKFLISILILIFILPSCSKDILLLKKEIDLLKQELTSQKDLIESIKSNAIITNIEVEDDSYTIYFSNGKSIHLTNVNTPLIYIGDNGNWFINNEDTGMPSQGESGQDGETPSISIINGFWWINGQDTKIRAEGKDGADAPHIINIVDNGHTLVFTFSDSTSISVNKIQGYYLNALGNIKGISTMGASLMSYPNTYIESCCNALGILCFNKAVAGVGTPRYFANKIWKNEYCTDEEFQKIDILVIQFASSVNLYCDEGVNLKDFPQNNIKEDDYFPNLPDAECLDYILKYWQNWCYVQKDNPSSQWYGTKYGKPFNVLFVTHWHDARVNYNNSIREVAEKWGGSVCEFDTNIGFSKYQPLADGTQVSVIYAQDTQEIDGVIYGWHPLNGQKGIYIQTKMANILIRALIDNFSSVQ